MTPSKPRHKNPLASLIKPRFNSEPPTLSRSLPAEAASLIADWRELTPELRGVVKALVAALRVKSCR
jgi:hypothetical protein